MKNLLFLLAFLSIGNTAFSKEKTSPVIVKKQNPCGVVYKNCYDYYIRNGVEPCLAEEWAGAAFLKCISFTF